MAFLLSLSFYLHVFLCGQHYSRSVLWVPIKPLSVVHDCVVCISCGGRGGCIVAVSDHRRHGSKAAYLSRIFESSNRTLTWVVGLEANMCRLLTCLDLIGNKAETDLFEDDPENGPKRGLVILDGRSCNLSYFALLCFVWHIVSESPFSIWVPCLGVGLSPRHFFLEHDCDAICTNVICSICLMQPPM
jgi:hypothetical protein